MVLCPVALAVGCKRCPVFSVCPAKSLIGDYRPGDNGKTSAPEQKSSSKKKD
jgi:hypothetical protein